MPLPQQGQVNPDYSTRGGFFTATIYSGIPAGPSLAAAPNASNVGADVCFFSGAGRLNTVMPTATMTSGATAIVFYDSAIPVSGGPIAASGHKIIAVYPTTLATASGTTQPTPAWQLNADMPFQSGLCVNTRSGQPGFTVSWSVETAGRQ